MLDLHEQLNSSLLDATHLRTHFHTCLSEQLECLSSCNWVSVVTSQRRWRSGPKHMCACQCVSLLFVYSWKHIVCLWSLCFYSVAIFISSVQLCVGRHKLAELDFTILELWTIGCRWTWGGDKMDGQILRLLNFQFKIFANKPFLLVCIVMLTDHLLFNNLLLFTAGVS